MCRSMRKYLSIITVIMELNNDDTYCQLYINASLITIIIRLGMACRRLCRPEALSIF